MRLMTKHSACQLSRSDDKWSAFPGDHIAEFLEFCYTVDAMKRDDVIDRVHRLFPWSQ